MNVAAKIFKDMARGKTKLKPNNICLLYMSFLRCYILLGSWTVSPTLMGIHYALVVNSSHIDNRVYLFISFILFGPKSAYFTVCIT